MAYGLQVFSASGALILDISHRCGRVIGTFNTGTSNGSTNITVPPTTQLWASLLNPSPDLSPALNVSGGTISWTFPSIGSANSIVVYGCY